MSASCPIDDLSARPIVRILECFCHHRLIEMAQAVVGRDDELASVLEFVDEMAGGASALVLEGEAGIGKSTLWLAGVAHARTRKLHTLTSRPAEPEHSLAYAALCDLFEDVLDAVLPALTTPRRRALEVATLREEVSGDPVDQRAVAVAVRDVLQLLSEKQPILIAIDDVQWLDHDEFGMFVELDVAGVGQEDNT